MNNIKNLIENVDLSTEGSIKDLCDKITAEEVVFLFLLTTFHFSIKTCKN